MRPVNRWSAAVVSGSRRFIRWPDPFGILSGSGRRRAKRLRLVFMIAFASLFLGLIVGPEPVELLVGDAVATVEVRLDGRLAGELRGEPWSLVCDFGSELRPHELVAVALDAEGHELGRARQWVNLPRPPADASVMLDGGADGRGVAARLSWRSVVATEPAEVAVTFDGRPIAVEDPRRIALPDHDPERLHFLRAELDFSRNVTTVLEVVFGGSYADRLNVELTAVPVVLAEGSKLPPLAELRGGFSRDGRPLSVVAAEVGPAEVILVRDETVRKVLNRIGRTSDKTLRRHARVGLKGQAARSLRYRMSLPKDHQVRFLWPSVQKRAHASSVEEPIRRGRVDFDLLSPSQAFTARDGGLYWLLTEYSPPAGIRQEQRLADAVAVAGLLAAGRNRRRAVVLVTRAGTADAGTFSAADARGYLRRLRVPLLVWTPEEATAELAARWGTVTDVSSMAKLEQAFRELKRRLARQRIVWVDGVHPPADVVLSRPGGGLRLAG